MHDFDELMGVSRLLFSAILLALAVATAFGQYYASLPKKRLRKP